MKKLLLLMLVAVLVLGNCTACGSLFEDEEIEDRDDKDRDDEDDDDDKEDDEEGVAGDTDAGDTRSYAQILQDLNAETYSVPSIVNQENALALVSGIVQSRVGGVENIDMMDLDASSKDSLNYNLLYRAGLGSSIPKTEDEIDYNYGAPYDNDTLNEYLSAFYEGGSVEITQYSGFKAVDEDHTVLMAADGDWGTTYESYEMYQDGDYVLFVVPCYDWPHWGQGKYLYTASILLKETGNELSAYQIVRVESVYESVNVVSVSVSSHLPNSSGKTYIGENLIDGKLETAWVENASGVGVGETIVFDLGYEQEVHEISIFNGYHATYNLHAKNGQVTNIRIEFDSGYSEEFELEYTDYYGGSDSEIGDMAQPVRIAFDEPILTGKIKITILDAVAGTAYEDTCISEIQIR